MPASKPAKPACPAVTQWAGPAARCAIVDGQAAEAQELVLLQSQRLLATCQAEGEAACAELAAESTAALELRAMEAAEAVERAAVAWEAEEALAEGLAAERQALQALHSAAVDTISQLRAEARALSTVAHCGRCSALCPMHGTPKMKRMYEASACCGRVQALAAS